MMMPKMMMIDCDRRLGASSRELPEDRIARAHRTRVWSPGEVTGVIGGEAQAVGSLVLLVV
tara:strand:+ start:828 stop:1010 length:183 start_codon:yes stop_codon:yes gene_type:complete